MGQKTHPYGFRLGIIKPWRSRYYARHDFPELLKEDDLIRKYLKTRLSHAAIADIHIERKPGKVTVTVHTGRPGVADSVAHQLTQRISFRRAMKRAVQSAMRMGAQGIKIKTAGRLGGAEIARTEGYHEGRVPLHTLRADIDYATSTAKTTYGTIGVKVWIFTREMTEELSGRTYSTGV